MGTGFINLKYTLIFLLFKALNHLAAEVNAKKLPAIADKAGLRLPSREKALMGRPCRIASASEETLPLPSAQSQELAINLEASVPLQRFKDPRVSKSVKGKQIILKLGNMEVG